MSYLLIQTDDGYTLTTVGLVAVGVLFLLVLAGASALYKKDRPGVQTRPLIFCAMAVALATITSMVKLYSFPFGGSVTLLSMLFICLPGYFYGVKTGVLAAVAYGILQFLIEPIIYYPIQPVVDYLLAFGVMGISGLFWQSKNGLIKGYIAAVLGRYVFVVLSGWIFFGAYAWEGWNPLPYSLAYNAAYVFTEAALTLIILAVPAVRRGFEHVRLLAEG
ncbi:MAG: energy-coupled thiamine transporter ThiT [Eubacterium sp.]|nr:energy-coupled thiamine transporter ThiT [Eubacterium sp.]